MRYVYLVDNVVREIIPQFDPKFPNLLPQHRYSPSFLNECVSISDDTAEITEGMVYNNGKFESPPEPEKVVITPTENASADVPEDLEGLRTQKIEELTTAMNNAIDTGVDVETSTGTEHFPLTNSDQTDIKTLYDTVKDDTSIAGLPYHSGDNLCRIYSREEITAIYFASLNYKTYHITYGNHICMWAKRATTVEELKSITYGCTLPDDLNEHFKEIISAMNSSATSSEE